MSSFLHPASPAIQLDYMTLNVITAREIGGRKKDPNIVLFPYHPNLNIADVLLLF